MRKAVKDRSPRFKISVLRKLRKRLEQGIERGMCYELNALHDLGEIPYVDNPTHLGMIKPKNDFTKFGMYWYETGESEPRIANVDRTIKRLQAQIKVKRKKK